MAGLSRALSGTEPVRDLDRAQLLLVGAFGLAVLLLVLAGVLNTVTYTETLATRDDTADDGRDVAAFQADARHAVSAVGARINDENASASDKRAWVRDNVSDWSRTVARYHGRDVTGVDVVVTDTSGGAHVNQTAERNFTSTDAARDWTLATDVSRVRRFEMDISRASLPADSCENVSCYELVVDDGSATWSVTLNESSLFVEGSNAADGTCAINSTSRVEINLTAGTVNGRDCAALTFADGLSTPYDVRYRNSSAVAGTYRLTVRDGSAVRENYAWDGEPSVSEFVSDASVRVTYRTPRLRYETVFRVAWRWADG